MRSVRNRETQTTAARERDRTLRRRGVRVVVVAVTGISILGYIALSLLVNSPPPPLQSNASAALIQPTSESQADTVTLHAETIYKQGNSITFTVSACGPHPYHAQLILNGLTASTYAEYLTGNHQFPVQMRVRSFNVQWQAPEANIDYSESSVQAVNVDLPRVLPCSVSQGDADEIDVYGTLTDPWLESSSVVGDFWHGPHASLSLPYVGYLESGIGGGPIPFTIQGLPGTWTEPDHQQVRIKAYPPADWTFDSALPALTNSDTPAWSGSSGISPTAQLSNPPSIAIIQDLIVVLAIIFGIGGALVASMLFESLRPSQEQHVRRPQTMESRHTNRKPILTALTALLVVTYMRRRRRGR